MATDPRFILKCWCSNDLFNADFDYALVVLKPEVIARLAARRATLNTALAADSDLETLVFTDYTPRYFAEGLLENWEEKGDATDAAIDSLIGGEEGVEVTDVFEVERSLYSECDRVEVTPSGVRWRCIPKHGDMRIETAELSWDEIGRVMLREVAR